MAMSTEASPQHATHLPSSTSYQSTPTSHSLAQHSLSTPSHLVSASSSFASTPDGLGNGNGNGSGSGNGNGNGNGNGTASAHSNGMGNGLHMHSHSHSDNLMNANGSLKDEDTLMHSQPHSLDQHALPPPPISTNLSGSTSTSSSTSNSASVSTPAPTKGKNGATGPAEGKTKPHMCQICARGFTTGGHLQRHQRIHTGVKAFKCPFPGCETRTSRQDNLQQHYRTHLSPTLRRGSGSGARAAVNAAMEAAGLKSTSTRAPRKSKGSAAGTPSSTTSASASHLPSPYATPSSAGPGPGPGTAAYGQPYMYDPQHYAAYSTIPPHSMTQPQSANSSRVPSPVNGHSTAHAGMQSMPPGHQHQHHPQQPYFHPFPPTYYPQMHHQAAYRYGASLPPSPYTAGPHGHHSMYSPGLVADHSHTYSPMQPGFPTHSRESSYGVITPAQYGPGTLANGYPPPRTQTSTPLSAQPHDTDDRYRRATSPRRRSSIGSNLAGGSGGQPHPHDMISQGVVDPSHMSTASRPTSVGIGAGGGGSTAPGAYGPYGSGGHHQHMHHGMGGYGVYNPMHSATATAGGNQHSNNVNVNVNPNHPNSGINMSNSATGSANTTPGGQGMTHRASISSMSDTGSGNGASVSDGQKPMHQ